MSSEFQTMIVNCGALNGPVDHANEAQVAQWLCAALKAYRTPQPVGPGFTEQATIDGALLAAATLAE